MTNVARDLIFHSASGFMAAKHLFVANEIGIFEHLAAGSATLEELAQRVGQPRPLRIVVDAMVALGPRVSATHIRRQKMTGLKAFVAAGAQTIVVRFGSPDQVGQLARFAREVLPLFVANPNSTLYWAIAQTCTQKGPGENKWKLIDLSPTVSFRASSPSTGEDKGD